jgi:hypothetical protein
MRWQGGERLGRLVGERHKEKKKEEGGEIDV